MVKELEYYKQPAHKFKTVNGGVEKAIKKRRQFALEYMSRGGATVEGSGPAAAIACGYSEKSAHVTSSRLLKDKRVQDFIRSHAQKVEKAAGASYEWKVLKLKEIVDLCMTGIQERDNFFKSTEVIAAIAELNKMAGDYAPTKVESKSLSVTAPLEEVARIMNEFKRDY